MANLVWWLLSRSFVRVILCRVLVIFTFVIDAFIAGGGRGLAQCCTNMTYTDPVYKNWLITMGGYTTAFVAQFFLVSMLL